MLRSGDRAKSDGVEPLGPNAIPYQKAGHIERELRRRDQRLCLEIGVDLQVEVHPFAFFPWAEQRPRKETGPLLGCCSCCNSGGRYRSNTGLGAACRSTASPATVVERHGLWILF